MKYHKPKQWVTEATFVIFTVAKDVHPTVALEDEFAVRKCNVLCIIIIDADHTDW